MATTKNYYTGDGNTTAFTFIFPYLNTSHIKVKLDGIVQATTEYTLTPTSNPTTVNFNTAPTNLAQIEIYRETSLTTANNVFAAGSSVKAASLNNNQTQALYALEEQENSIEKGEIFSYANANHSAGATAPTTPSSGDTWFDSTSGRTYIYYEDVDSSQWVEANPPFDADGSRSFTQTGTGAVARTWDSKLTDIISVNDFGAIGDGVANDTTAIQNALNEAGTKEKNLYVPAGTYLITTTLYIPAGVRVIGEGKYNNWSTSTQVKGTIFKTSGTLTGVRWTDITGSDATDDTPLLVAKGNGVYLENLTLLTESNNWSIGVLFPCVKQCGFSGLQVFGFTDAGVYLDATWSDRNTTLKNLHTSISPSSGMNEFVGRDFWIESKSDTATSYGIKIQGSTRDPDDYATDDWLWGWGGTSDIVFEKGRLSNFLMDAAIKNTAKAGQGVRFVNVDFRAGSRTNVLKLDRANRVEFFGGYSESNTDAKITFTGNTASAAFYGGHWITAKINFIPKDWNGTNALGTGTSYTTGDRVAANGRIYEATTTATSTGSTAPSHTDPASPTAVGGVTWDYLQDADVDGTISGTTIVKTINLKPTLAFNTDTDLKGIVYLSNYKGDFSHENLGLETGSALRLRDIPFRPDVDGTSSTGISLGTSGYHWQNAYIANKVIFKDGGGIDFTAVPGGTDTSSTNSLLDDYEEGTCQAIIADAATSGNTGSTETGTYTKIGNLVHLILNLSNIDVSGLTSSNDLYIRGLPFANASAYRVVGSVLTDSVNYDGIPVAAIDASVNYLRIPEMRDNTTDDSGIRVTEITDDTSDILISITYQTS